jgi:hypothetical protein
MFQSTTPYSSKVTFWCKSIKCILYDLIVHLIYLDNFSEKKTNKTSLGKKELPVPQIFMLLSVPQPPPWREKRVGPPPVPGANSGESLRAALGVHPPAPWWNVRLINFIIMVLNSLMFFFEMSQL